MRVEALRSELLELHEELLRNGLVSWTGGNMSEEIVEQLHRRYRTVYGQ